MKMSIKDSESLDRCIQTTLSALYPPFQATSPTVLCQVLNVVESYYRGDGLRYLLHFLLPAKQFLQKLQQDACLQYCGLLFHHEGWPLCLHEKVVIQLCPLDRHLLHPGDFYLLIFFPRAHSASCRTNISSAPCLLLCSVSGSHHVEQQEVSEVALQSLFTMAWLASVNREREQRGLSRLERCLLSANGDVFRVPWEDLVYPQFISRPRASLKEGKEISVRDSDMLVNMPQHECSSTDYSGQDIKPLPFSLTTDQSTVSSEGEDSEGEYVELTELPLPRFSPQKGSLTQFISLQHRARTSTPAHTHSAAATDTPTHTNTHSAAAPNHSTHLSRPCVEASPHNSLRCRLIEEHFKQDSCATFNPISFASSPSAPPEAVVSSSSQLEQRLSQEHKEGTESTQSLNTEAESSIQQTQQEEVEQTEEEEADQTHVEEAKQTDEVEQTEEVEAKQTDEKVEQTNGEEVEVDQTEEEVEAKQTDEEVEQTEEEEAVQTDVEETEEAEAKQTNEEEAEAKQTNEEEVEAKQTNEEEVEAKQTDEEEVEAKQTDEEEVEAKQTDEEEVEAKQTDEEEVEQTEQEGAEQTDDEEAEQTEQEEAEQTEQEEAEQTDDEEVEAEPIEEEEVEVEQTDEEEVEVEQTDEEEVEQTEQEEAKQADEEVEVEQTDEEEVEQTDEEEVEQADEEVEEEQIDEEEVEEEQIDEEEVEEEQIDEVEAEQSEGQGVQKCDMSVEGDEVKQEEMQQKTECREDEDLVQHTHTVEENETEQSEGDGKELNEDGAEEVEVEEVVQVTILQQSQEGREEKVVKGDKGEEEAEKGTTGENDRKSNVHCKNIALQTLPNNFSCAKRDLETLRIVSEDSGEQPDSGEFWKPLPASEENNSHYKHCADTLGPHSEDSYCENKALNKQPSDPFSQHSADSYDENHTLNKHSADSCCKNNALPTHCGESGEFRMPCVSTPAMALDSLWTKPDKSENGQIKQMDDDDDEEEEEDCSCGEVGEGTGKLHAEGIGPDPSPVQSEFNLGTGPTRSQPESPTASSQLKQPNSPTVPAQMSLSGFHRVLLSSGAICLPGTKDKSGRALLVVHCTSSVWSSPDCDSAELLRLLLYYTSTLREEVRALGLTVLADARRAAPAAALFSALRSLQENNQGSVNTVLLLINKDSSLHLDKPAQVEVLSSLKAVQKHVELRHLPTEFGGFFSFSQSSWLCFRSRIEQLSSQCDDVINLLQKTINILQSTPLPTAAEGAEHLLSRFKAVMRSILEDRRLVQLQQEGGASLSRLRREESSFSMTEEYQVEVEAVSRLYNQVDELLHRLVTLSNSRTQELNFILEFKSLEQGFTEVRSWLDNIGEVHLKTLEEPADSLELLKSKQQDFRQFFATAYDQCKRGEALLGRLEQWDDMASAGFNSYEVKVHSFWARLQDFSQRVKTTGQNIERAVQLYHFLDQAYGWALAGMRHLAGTSMEDCTLPDKCQVVIGNLEDYQRQHPPIPDARFQEMKVVAGELRGERGLRQWSFAWSKCQETKKMFDRKMEAALRTRDSALRRRSDSALSRSSTSSRKSLAGLWGIQETSPCLPEEDTNRSSPPCTSSLPITASPPTPQHTPLFQRLFRSFSSDDSSDPVASSSSSPSLRLFDNSACSISSRRQQLRKTQSFDCPPTPEVLRYGSCTRALSEPVRRGNTGVFIRGLEVSSTEAAGHTLCPRTPSTPRTSSVADPRPRGSKLRHIVEELVTTEREYVRSLRYIIHHYFPEMDRVDIPQDLRGKRSVIFGNLEKLLDFHSQFFLKELEACWKHPLRVPHCFLRHQEQFSLYALYSKNKPKSDALLSNHGNSFFRRKQVELGDKMDLSSYLLKPIQRMSKYALLLMDLMKEVSEAQEAELVALQFATNMVKFQLRHGNDLLAMDAIQDCDVNLKEQGQLIRQDEFTVWTGRRKCQRHIFLFEELILFSKPRKIEGGLDVFIYKHSFKTADVGLTESTGDSGLKFEIWFRRRTSKSQTFILQATTEDVKNAWTSDIARILWNQANRNKEMRLKEMVSMGVGNKPFLDIQPSDAAISDRAVHYIMKSRGARTRASIAVSVFDHSNPFQRGTVASDPTASGPSSSSLLGPLNLHMYSQSLSSPSDAENSFITCIEEDEHEHETSSQPSMTTESSGSSSHCLSGSTGSDSGCVTSHLQEVLPEETSPLGPPSSSRKQQLSHRFPSAKSAPAISPATIV